MHPSSSVASLLTFGLLLGSGLAIPASNGDAALQASGFRYLNAATQKYQVKSLPEVGDDVGELYSGSIPLGNGSESLFFIFQPATNGPSEDIMTSIESGPACSSLGGFFRGLGRWNWLDGQILPSENPFPWTNSTNMLWVEELPGVGFSQGPVDLDARNVAANWVVFYEKFQKLFGIKNYKHYMTGNFYAGQYIPYMSAAMLDQNDTTYFDVGGNLLFTPLISDGGPQEIADAVPWANEYQVDLRLNETTVASLQKAHETCGYAAYEEKYLVYPASGHQPVDSTVFNDTDGECYTFGNIYLAALELNPCFVSGTLGSCPVSSILELSPEPINGDLLTQTYFNRADVKKALHAPSNATWSFCDNSITTNTDFSLSALQGALPRVIEATNRTLISQGSQNFILTANGTLLAIQNMTWGGDLGFQQAPTTPLITDQGTVGTQHFERGLMWSEVFISGGDTAQDQPAIGFQYLQWVLGKIDQL